MNPIRAAAQRMLDGVPGAFLRCDRGRALYVTNAGMRSAEQIDWNAAGFEEENVRGLTFLSPGSCLTKAFQTWAMESVSGEGLAAAVGNACFFEMLPEDRTLFIEGVKRLEMNGDAAGYEKLVRQRAAVCLREKRGGGTLYACALIADMMKRGGTENED